MCFSLQASAIAAGSLTILGAIGVTRHHADKTKFIAAIPFIFGIQQASEAVTWAQLPFKLSAATVAISTYTFLFFAYFFWPVWVPFAVWYAEPNATRKNIILLTIAGGAIIGATLLYFLTTSIVTSAITCAHIIYDVTIPEAWYIPGMLLYVGATIVPWFISSFPKMWLVGSVLAISYGVSIWFYFAAFTSVWCFFAAVLSILILVVLHKQQRNAL